MLKIRAAPGIEETRCPHLNPIFKTALIKSETKSGDAELTRLLDPVGPLVHGLDDPDGFSPEEAHAGLLRHTSPAFAGKKY